MLYKGKLRRAELYDDHTYPYTNVKAVYEANRDRLPGCRLIVTNAHWYGPGPKPCGNYKAGGTVVSKQYNSAVGFSWSGDERPVMGWNDMRGCENFVGTIPALVGGVRQDVGNQTAGVKRSCARTWWGFDSAGDCIVEVTTGDYTLTQIIDRMEDMGIVDGLVLDGSGSSQWYDGKSWNKGDGRTVYSFLLLWYEDKPAGDTETEEKRMKIYLSPSSQAANAYAWGGTNEQVQCNRIAEAARTALARCGFEVRKAPEGQAYQTNVAESNAWGANLHIPIHTNAGGGHGPAVFVYGLTEARKKYAQAVYAALNAVVPVKSSYGVRANPGLYETKNTTATCVYCECAFHDYAEEAKWIVEHVDELGEAIARGVCTGAGVDYIQPEKVPESEGGDAELAARELIAKGWGDVLVALAGKI